MLGSFGWTNTIHASFAVAFRTPSNCRGSWKILNSDEGLARLQIESWILYFHGKKTACTKTSFKSAKQQLTHGLSWDKTSQYNFFLRKLFPSCRSYTNAIHFLVISHEEWYKSVYVELFLLNWIHLPWRIAPSIKSLWKKNACLVGGKNTKIFKFWNKCKEWRQKGPLLFLFFFNTSVIESRRMALVLRNFF